MTKLNAKATWNCGKAAIKQSRVLPSAEPKEKSPFHRREVGRIAFWSKGHRYGAGQYDQTDTSDQDQTREGSNGLHVLHTSSPMVFHFDADHKTQKYDTHILSDNQVKEIPKQFYIDNALQMQANWYRCSLLQRKLLFLYSLPEDDTH